MAQDLLDYQATAQLLGGVSPKTVRRLVRNGTLRPVRIGRRVLFSRVDVERLLTRDRLHTGEQQTVSNPMKVGP